MLRFAFTALVLSAMTFASVSAFAAEDQKAAAFVLCKNQKTVRTIRVMPENNNDENCSITYSKGGVEEVVGANRSMSSCKSILAHIRQNLESSKWNCHSVSSANVTDATDTKAVNQ